MRMKIVREQGVMMIGAFQFNLWILWDLNSNYFISILFFKKALINFKSFSKLLHAIKLSEM
jgi:hypothetical protein